MSWTLRLTAQAEADALRQSADAEVQNDETSAASAKALAAQLAAERQQLEAGTPDARCGPTTLATSGKQLARPVPNSSAAGMPGQRRNRISQDSIARRRLGRAAAAQHRGMASASS